MTSHDSEIEALLSKAWAARTSQRIEECSALCVELKRKLALPLGKAEVERLSELMPDSQEWDGIDPVVETLLLHGSLARCRLQFDYSAKFIHKLATLVDERALPPNFWLRHEQGITYFMVGDYPSALECFIDGGALAVGPFQTYLAAINALLCSENLGLATDGYYNRAKGAAQKLRSNQNRRNGEVDGALSLFELREQFRAGNLRSIFKVQDGKGEVCSKLQQYFLSWIEGLPYHARSAPPKDSHTLMELTGLHQGSYRFRTLSGLTHPDDTEALKPMDVVERVYLWVWRWLACSESLPAFRFVKQIQDLFSRTDLHSLSVEDSLQLRNALTWLSLFDSRSDALLKRLRSTVALNPGISGSLYEIERLTAEYLVAVKNQQNDLAGDVLENLRVHPLWLSKEVYFRQLVLGVNGGGTEQGPQNHPLGRVIKNLKELLGDSAEKRPIVIDLNRNIVRVEGTDIISEALATAFDLLHAKKVVPCHEFLACVFQISNYDPLVHDTKIFNLLARARKIVSQDLKLGVKSGNVFAKGSWDSFGFIQPSGHVFELRRNLDWQSMVGVDKKIPKTPPKKRVGAKCDQELVDALAASTTDRFARQDAERILGATRSTTNRILERLVKKGFLGIEGNGPRRTYCIQDQFRNMGEDYV